MKTTNEDLIKPIKQDLEKNMHEHCKRFIESLENTEDTTNDLNFLWSGINGSPRYYNFKRFNRDTKVLTIASTQLWELPNILSFEVQTDEDIIFCDEFWPEFKAFRTDFLEKHYPSIKTY